MSLKKFCLLGLCAVGSLASPTYEVKDKKRQTESNQLYFVFSGNTFETIPPPDGTASTSYSTGFSIFTGSGINLYNEASINGYAPCRDGGNDIGVSGACLGSGPDLRLSCAADALGTPGSCAAWNGDTVLDCEKSNSSVYNDFITTGASGACVVSFILGNYCAISNDIALTYSTVSGSGDGPPCDPCPSCD